MERLRLFNFKSYDGQHEVPFKDFTAVIGPNGSGKSNLLDALSFVLGVRLDAEKSRARVLTDLLHRKPDETLEDVEASGRGNAYVELVHKSADGVETEFKRTLNSKGVSQYHVDGRRVEFARYKEQLESIGIWIEAKNFLVFQGDVEGIAFKSPKELAELVEKISGSARFKHAYDEAKAEVEAREEAFTQSFEQKRFVVREKQQLRAQKDEAEQYQQILAQFQASKVNLALFQLFHLQHDIDVKTKQAQQEAKEHAARFASLQALNESLQGVAAETARLRKEQAVADKQLSKSSAVLEKKRPGQVALRQEIAHLTKSLSTEKSKLDKAQADATVHGKTTRALEKELAAVQASLDELRAAMEAEDEKSKELQLAAAQLAEYNALKQQSAVESAELTARIKGAQHEQRSAGESVDSLRILLANIEERMASMHATQAELRERKQRNEDTVTSSREQLKQLKADLAKLREKQEAIKQRKLALESELLQVKDQVQEAKSERASRESNAKLSETVETLKAHFSGVRGVLSELMALHNPKYATAVSVAFGRHMDSVAVDEQDTALSCIAYLRDQRLPPITFIPLDTIKVKPIAESTRQQKDKGFSVAIDCIQFDDDLEKAFLYAFGDALICEDKNEDVAVKRSQDLCYGHRQAGAEKSKYKVITLGGTVIHKSGNLTGGTSAKGDRSSRLRAGGDKTASKTLISEKEYTRLRDRQDALVKQLLEVEAEAAQAFRTKDEEESLVSRIASTENRLKYAEQDLAAVSKKHDENEDKLKNMQSEAKKMQPKLAEAEKELEEKAAAVASLESELGKREEKLFRAFSKKVGVSNIREFESERLKLAEQYHAEQAAKLSELNRLKDQLQYEKDRDLQAPVNKHKQKIQDIEGKIKQKKKEDEQLESELSVEQSKIKDQIEKAETLRKEMEAKQNQLKQAKKQVSDLENAVQGLERSVSLLRSQVSTLKLSRHEVLRQAAVDGLELPELEPESDLSKRKKKRQRRRGDEDMEEDEEEEEEEKTAEDEEMGGATGIDPATLAAEGRRRFDYSDIDESYLAEDATPADRERWRQEFLKVLAHHQSTLDSLAPNLKAIGQFEDVSNKFASTKAEWEDKKRMVKQAQEHFDTIKEQRLKTFMTAYEHLARAVKATYTQLTASAEMPIGGSAYLTLESIDEPYLHGVKYSAMPPAKRFRAMSELSGGEKAVASLAMLFAIHSFRPAPFFVLDEIDAALDNINVARVANYIRARCHREHLQVVVISLKDSFYNKADALVGVYKDQEKQSSAHLTMDLTKFA